jgi:hypothetical protein
LQLAGSPTRLAGTVQDGLGQHRALTDLQHKLEALGSPALKSATERRNVSGA